MATFKLVNLGDETSILDESCISEYKKRTGKSIMYSSQVRCDDPVFVDIVERFGLGFSIVELPIDALDCWHIRKTDSTSWIDYNRGLVALRRGLGDVLYGDYATPEEKLRTLISSLPPSPSTVLHRLLCNSCHDLGSVTFKVVTLPRGGRLTDDVLTEYTKRTGRHAQDIPRNDPVLVQLVQEMDPGVHLVELPIDAQDCWVIEKQLDGSETVKYNVEVVNLRRNIDNVLYYNNTIPEHKVKTLLSMIAPRRSS